MEEKQFKKALNEIKDLASLQGGFVSELQISECLPEITEEQKPLVFDFLKQSGIGINEPLVAGEDVEAEGYLKFYLEELEDIVRVDETMKTLLLRDALQGDQTAKEKVINAYLPVVLDIAKLYAGQGVDMEDLIGEGNVALTAAVGNLECVETPEEADALIGKLIMNAMEAYIGIENDEEHMMEQVLTDTAKVLEKAKQMAEDLLRKVTVEELSGESGISKEEILRAAEIAKECADYIELSKREA
ncbi:MAG: hypothetical protein K2K20_11550 [Lachnospiraceae bacterium]|nr:hypothetical protein [Lachnospiraceae bacterium]